MENIVMKLALVPILMGLFYEKVGTKGSVLNRMALKIVFLSKTWLVTWYVIMVAMV